MCGLATSAQLQSIVGKVEKNESDIREIRKEIGKMSQKLDKRPSEIGLISSPNRVPLGGRTRFGPGRELSYHMSRKSLRIWPIKGSSDSKMKESLLDFIVNALRILESEAKAIGVERVRRTRSAP